MFEDIRARVKKCITDKMKTIYAKVYIDDVTALLDTIEAQQREIEELTDDRDHWLAIAKKLEADLIPRKGQE